MKHIVMVMVLLLLNINFKTWKKIPENSSTLVFVIVVNLVYYFICQKKLLWEFQTNDLSLNKVRLIQIFLATPLIANLFLSGIPSQSSKMKSLYLLKYICASTIFEWFANKKIKLITFYNGWNVKWSVTVYLQMYVLSFLHTKNPFFTWLLTIFTMHRYVDMFNIPLSLNMLKPASIQEFFRTNFIEER